MERSYPWYEVVGSEHKVLQGDFIDECPVVTPPLRISDDVEISISNYDVIVMSQSCDLEQQNLELVLVCPVWPISEFEKSCDFFKSRKGKEALRQGNTPGYHLLNKSNKSGHETDYTVMVVDFRSVYGVPFDFLTSLVASRGTRLRLLPPYREHLSQAFARFFMRVGLPVDIPPFR